MPKKSHTINFLVGDCLVVPRWQISFFSLLFVVEAGGVGGLESYGE